MHQYSFEKLDVWVRSKEFVKRIYSLTEGLPAGEKYGMTSQLKRASLSIPTNLAEGTARRTARDQSYFTNISYSSLMEVLNLLIIAYEMELIEREKYVELRKMINEMAVKINALHNAQRKGQ